MVNKLWKISMMAKMPLIQRHQWPKTIYLRLLPTKTLGKTYGLHSFLLSVCFWLWFLLVSILSAEGPIKKRKYLPILKQKKVKMRNRQRFLRMWFLCIDTQIERQERKHHQGRRSQLKRLKLNLSFRNIESRRARQL